MAESSESEEMRKERMEEIMGGILDKRGNKYCHEIGLELNGENIFFESAKIIKEWKDFCREDLITSFSGEKWR